MANKTFSGKTRLNLAQGAQGGPLDALYSSEYDFESLYYPRNLGDATRGHSIIFYINVASNSSYVNGSSYTGSTMGGYTNVGIIQAAGRTAINQANQAQSGPAGTKDLMNALTVRKTKRITQGIALYMPESVKVNYNADWQSESLTEAAGNLGLYGSAIAQGWDWTKAKYAGATTSSKSGTIAEIAAKVSQGAGLTGGGTTDFALFTQGLAVNPQLEVLFKGTNMREFSFDFLFAPFDADESRSVLNIVRTFRFHQAPEIQAGSAGRFFIPPSEFDIDFMVNGELNDKIYQIGTCVLKSVDIDYSPNGWATFEDGSPTQIKLSLSFTETEIVTKERVQKDNY